MRSKPQNRFQELLVTAGFGMFGMVYLFHHARPMNLQIVGFFVVGVVVLGYSFYRVLHPRTSELVVTNLSIRSKTSGLVGSSAEILRMSVTYIGFGYGGENESNGLELRSGWGSGPIMLPYLTEEQASKVADLIYEHFPDTPTGTGQPSNIITLGLNP